MIYYVLGDNPALTIRKKSGFRNQLELVMKSIKNGWSKEHTGSHIVRNNTVYSCGQTGIVGHMGGAFSEIYRNHIYDIGLNDFKGAEIAGIKLHAAADTYIHHNCIHHTKRGLWLDWKAQGVRVSSNVFYDNTVNDDMYAEVTHGPLLIDNNIFASPYSMQIQAQGSAFINNWFGGKFIRHKKRPTRYTPYHIPHSTEVLGFSVVYAGDAVPFEREQDCSVHASGVSLIINEEDDGVYAEIILPKNNLACRPYGLMSCPRQYWQRSFLKRLTAMISYSTPILPEIVGTVQRFPDRFAWQALNVRCSQPCEGCKNIAKM